MPQVEEGKVAEAAAAAVMVAAVSVPSRVYVQLVVIEGEGAWGEVGKYCVVKRQERGKSEERPGG